MGSPDASYLLFADLLTEPVLLVSAEGVIYAANRAVGRRFPQWAKELVGQRLADLVLDAPSEIERYLKACARTRELLPGSLTLRCLEGDALSCRCEGAVLVPRSERDPALVYLRLFPKAETPSQFVLLNQRIDALTAEVVARKRAEADLLQRQAEVEALNAGLQRAIAETHHRVKNNLQAVIALLEMQKEEAAQGLLPVQALNESFLQIKTIALVHDLLSHRGPVGEVEVNQVLSKLAELLASSLGGSGKRISVFLDAQTVWLPTQAAIALALVVNELISNAYKHGRASERNQENDGIMVRLFQQDADLFLEVYDRGVGFPPGFTLASHARLGLALVQSLVEHDLRGDLSFLNAENSSVHGEPAGGTVCVHFPVPSRTD